jgi:hypothetical protein
VKHRLRLTIGALALVAAPTVAIVGTTAPAGALTTITVTTTDDGGAGSLREAFAAADAADPESVEIVLQRGVTYLLDDCEEGALLHSEANALTVTGNGSTIEQTCEGARVITNVNSAGHLTVTDVTITGGNVGEKTGGGGIGATTDGLTIINSTLAGNSAGSGGAVFVTGGGSLLVINSTIADNVATGETGTGGLEAQGGITLAYATITGNTAGGTDEPANLRTGADLTSFGSVIAQPLGTNTYNCIVQTSGISQGYNWSDDDTCKLATATDVQTGTDPMLGALTEAGRIPPNSDCLTLDCGSALVRVPLAGSPLIDAIPNSACQTGAAAAVTGDERDFGGRPSPNGGACDIGAIEVQAVTPSAPVFPAPELVLAPKFTG